MTKKELDVENVLKIVQEAKKQVAEIHDSVDPGSSTRGTLMKVDSFLKAIETEVVYSLPKERKKKSFSQLFSFLLLLMPILKLLKELLAEAKLVINLLQR